MARRKYDVTGILARHSEGRTMEDAGELLARVVQEVVRYGGKGKVTIDIEVKPNGEGSAIKIEPKLKHTLPARTQGESFYFSDEDGSLFRDPPADEADALLGRNVVTHPTRKE